VSIGLAVIFGMMGIINLAHGEFLMLGAYFTLTGVRAGLNLWVAMVVAAAAVGLFGLIVERLTGQSYAEFLAARCFVPLGMQSTIFGDSAVIVPRRPSAAYIREGGVLKHTSFRFSASHFPAAGLNASIVDLARFLAGIDAGRVLQPGSLRSMWEPTRLNDGTTLPYGLGWTISTHRDRTVVGHEGGGAAWIAYFPAERLAIAAVCNLNGARADELPYGVADLYLGR